jgi:hypothetical protein
MSGRFPWRKAIIACGLAIPHAVACLPSNSSGPEADTDHDGLSDREELLVYGTSPLMPDTDGDGLTDYQEVVTYGFDPQNDPDRFNPRVADVPTMSIVVTGPPIVRFEVVMTDGTTYTIDNSIAESVTVGVTNSVTQHQGQANTQSVSQTNTQDMSVSPSTMNQTSLTTPLGNSVSETFFFIDGGGGGSDGGTDAGGEAGVAPDAEGADAGAGGGDAEAPDATAGTDGGSHPVLSSETVTQDPATLTQTNGNSTTLTFDNSVSTTVNPSTTVDTSIDFTQDQMQQNQRTLTQDQSLAQNHQIATNGATIRVPAMIENSGHVAFRCTNLFLGAVLVTTNGTMIALGNLELDQSIVTSFVPFALAPGESVGPTNFVTPTLELSAAFDILGSGRALILSLATYELDDSKGVPYAFDLTDIGSKSALVAIDYGKKSSRQPELYQVATNYDPSHPGATVAQIFQNILYVPYFAAPQTGLLAVRDTAMTSSGGPHWSVSIAHDQGPDLGTTTYGDGVDPYDFDGIQVQAGDVLHLAFVPRGGSAPTDGGLSRPPEGTGPADASYHPVVERPPDASVPPNAGPP